jgi:hypothetical protein
MSTQEEFELLKDIVKDGSPSDAGDVQRIVSGYFTKVTRSNLKDEWENKMTENERQALYTKLLIYSVEGMTKELRKLNFDDLDMSLWD